MENKTLLELQVLQTAVLAQIPFASNVEPQCSILNVWLEYIRQAIEDEKFHQNNTI